MSTERAGERGLRAHRLAVVILLVPLRAYLAGRPPRLLSLRVETVRDLRVPSSDSPSVVPGGHAAEAVAQGFTRTVRPGGG